MLDAYCSLIAHIKSISQSEWLYLQTLSKIQPLFTCTLLLPRSKPPSFLLDCYSGLLAAIFSTSEQSDHVKTKYVHHFSAPNPPLAPCNTQNKSQGTLHFLQSSMWSGPQSPLYYCTHPLHSPHCIHSSHLVPLMSLKCARHASTSAFALANSSLEHSPTTPSITWLTLSPPEGLYLNVVISKNFHTKSAIPPCHFSFLPFYYSPQVSALIYFRFYVFIFCLQKYKILEGKVFV